MPIQHGPAELPEHEEVQDTEFYQIDPRTLVFMLGELPFITSLYERARVELDDDRNLSIDGVKELLLTARQRYYEEMKGRARAHHAADPAAVPEVHSQPEFDSQTACGRTCTPS